MEIINNHCFIVAEAGVAHNGDIRAALKLVDIAKSAGADAVKFQVYRTINFVNKGTAQFKNYALKELPYSDFITISDYAKDIGITFFATPHDDESLDFLISLSVLIIKIGSGELGNWKFIEKIARTQKKVFVSVGMYEDADIKELIDIFYSVGNDKLTLLHCVTMYPTPPEEVRLSRIKYLRDLTGHKIGYSDHTKGYHISLAAAILGASVIEKHIMLPETYGRDTQVALYENEFKEMVLYIREIEKALLGIDVSQKQMINKFWATKNPETGKRN